MFHVDACGKCEEIEGKMSECEICHSEELIINMTVRKGKLICYLCTDQFDPYLREDFGCPV